MGKRHRNRKRLVPGIRWMAPGVALLLCLSLLMQHCSLYQDAELPERKLATEMAIRWNQLALDLERHTMGYRPPVSARMFAYVEMAAYEASLPDMPDYISMEKFVEGYQKPSESFGKDQFSLPSSINAAYAQILRRFFASAPKKILLEVDLQEQRFRQNLPANTPEMVVNNSVAFGQKVADIVWEWSKTDKEGHNGHLYNYDHGYEPQSCESCWQPTGEHASPALLPYWGRVRPFLSETQAIAFKEPLPFDKNPGSDFYAEAMEVFSVSQPLSKENRWIAEYWSDDHPGLTSSPAARWISIANQAFAKSEAPFPVVIETYLKSAIALHDAGVRVWGAKYQYNVVRPETYIQKYIDPKWEPLHPTPSFPAYPSGHAAFGAAASEVLADALGTTFELSDRTHEKRPEFAGTPRNYHSFGEMARENAASRVLLGVHYRMDCTEGMRLGKIIGRNAVALPLKRNEAAVY
ncbi:MAG: vanadium-dependent haloperoxidase [Saprospiraceae bacterium]|nr:vanadium-dependent haloperoxidase [Saprospiraceae bacterium]